MELSEAIQHCEEKAKELKIKADELNNCDAYSKSECLECAKEHKQLAEWLKELKAYREGKHCDTCKYKDSDGGDYPCIYCHPSESRWEYGGDGG